MHQPLQRRVVSLVLAAVALLGAGCGSDNASSSSTTRSSGRATTSSCGTDTPPTTAPAFTGGDAQAAISERGKPTPTVPRQLPDKLVTTDLIVGSGTEVADKDKVTVQYLGVQASDCKEFDSSWARGSEPATFGLDQVIKGWSQGLVGMKVGGRRQLVIPPDLAYGDSAQAGAPSGTLVFVVDLVSVQPAPRPDPAAVAAAAARGKPTVTVPDPLPTTLTITDLVPGTGAAATPTSTVIVQYVGVQRDGQEFDSSWSRNAEPVTFPLNQVIPGWSQGLVGMKVGGRRQLVIPAALAYGDTPQNGRPSGTLIFVIDLLGVA